MDLSGRTDRTVCFRSEMTMQRAKSLMAMSLMKVGSSSTHLIMASETSEISSPCTCPLNLKDTTSRTISVEIGRYLFTILLVCNLAILVLPKLRNATARAPNGYYKGDPQTKNKKTEMGEKLREWHQGPPRVGTFSMRATRFRLRAGCLSWEKKDGTVAKNQRILDVIPARYKDPTVNSTKGWRDLNTAEIKKIKDGAMKKPQQGPKKKRAAEAKKEAEDFQKNEEYEERGGSQGGCFEYTAGRAEEEENYVSPDLYHGSAAGFSRRRPWTNIKPDNELDFHGGLSLPEPSKRSREQKSTKMGNLEEDFEARPFKKGRTPMHAHNSQGVRDGTNLLPHTRSKSQKPRHRRTGGPKPEDAVEESMRFSSATNPYDLQDQGIHTWPSSAGFNHTLAPLPESLGQPWDTLGRNAEARRSPKELRSDEWRQSDTRDPQTYFHQDNLDSDYFHEPPPGPHEGFTLGSQSIGFHAGFANVSSQVRGFDMNDSTSLPAVTQYKSSQYDLSHDDYSQGDYPQDGFPQDGYPWDVYPQNDLPHERFPQNSFSRDSLPQTIPPQDTGPFEGLTRESLRQEHPWNGSLYDNPSCKDALPPMPPPAIVTGKRKRTDDPSHRQPKQERKIKRARSSKTALLPSPEVSLAACEDSEYGHSQRELVESQHARLPQTEGEFPKSFPSPLPSSFGYRRNGGRPPIEMHGSPSETNSDYGISDGPATGPLHGEPYLQAHDPIHIGTELQSGFDHDAYLPADFHRGQWEAIQASLSTDWHRDWRAQKSRYNA